MAYEILIYSLPFLLGYLSTYALYKLSLIKKSFHINFWNFILTIIFLISAGAGFMLLILMEIGIKLPINAGLNFWHVEVGITLVLLTVLHFHVYWKSARYLFRPIKRRSQL